MYNEGIWGQHLPTCGERSGAQLPARPMVPFQSHPTLPTGHCESQQCMGSDESYVLHLCHGASTLPLGCLAAPCVGACGILPVALPLLGTLALCH